MSSSSLLTAPGAAVSASDGHALAEGPDRQAARAALKAVDEARAHGHPIVLCEALTDAARCLAALHAYTQSEDYLQQALHWAGMLHSADLRADLLCALAEVACNEADLLVQRKDHSQEGVQRRQAARERARDWSHEAACLAGATSDPHWEVKVLLRASDVLDRGGDRDEAVLIQNRAMTLMGLAETHPSDAPDAAPGVVRVAAVTTLM